MDHASVSDIPLPGEDISYRKEIQHRIQSETVIDSQNTTDFSKPVDNLNYDQNVPEFSATFDQNAMIIDQQLVTQSSVPQIIPSEEQNLSEINTNLTNSVKQNIPTENISEDNINDTAQILEESTMEVDQSFEESTEIIDPQTVRQQTLAEAVEDLQKFVEQSTQEAVDATEILPETMEITSESTETSEIKTEDSEVKSEDPTSDSTEIITENAKLLPGNAESIPENSEIITENAEIITENAEIITENVEVITENAEIITEHAEIITENSEIVTENPEIVTENAEIITENTEVISETTEVISETTETVENSTELTVDLDDIIDVPLHDNSVEIKDEDISGTDSNESVVVSESLEETKENISLEVTPNLTTEETEISQDIHDQVIIEENKDEDDNLSADISAQPAPHKMKTPSKRTIRTNSTIEAIKNEWDDTDTITIEEVNEVTEESAVTSAPSPKPVVTDPETKESNKSQQAEDSLSDVLVIQAVNEGMELNLDQNVTIEIIEEIKNKDGVVTGENVVVIDNIDQLKKDNSSEKSVNSNSSTATEEKSEANSSVTADAEKNVGKNTSIKNTKGTTSRIRVKEERTSIVPCHLLGRNVDNPTEDLISNGRTPPKPRLGVKVPYRFLTSQIVSKNEIAKELLEIHAKRNPEPDPPAGGDIFFAQKLTQRLAKKINESEKIKKDKVFEKVEDSKENTTSGIPEQELLTPPNSQTSTSSTPSSNKEMSMVKSATTVQAQTASTSSATNKSITDNSDLLAILEGDVDVDLTKEIKNTKLKSTDNNDTDNQIEKALEGISSNINTIGRKRNKHLDPEMEREIALQQLRSMPQETKKPATKYGRRGRPGKYSYTKVNVRTDTVSTNIKTEVPTTPDIKPAISTSKSTNETRKLISETRKPTSETLKPTPEIRKPTSETRKPTSETPKPTSETPKPTSETPKPTSEAPKLTSENPETILITAESTSVSIKATVELVKATSKVKTITEKLPSEKKNPTLSKIQKPRKDLSESVKPAAESIVDKIKKKKLKNVVSKTDTTKKSDNKHEEISDDLLDSALSPKKVSKTYSRKESIVNVSVPADLELIVNDQSALENEMNDNIELDENKVELSENTSISSENHDKTTPKQSIPSIKKVKRLAGDIYSPEITLVSKRARIIKPKIIWDPAESIPARKLKSPQVTEGKAKRGRPRKSVDNTEKSKEKSTKSEETPEKSDKSEKSQNNRESAKEMVVNVEKMDLDLKDQLETNKKSEREKDRSVKTLKKGKILSQVALKKAKKILLKRQVRSLSGKLIRSTNGDLKSSLALTKKKKQLVVEIAKQVGKVGRSKTIAKQQPQTRNRQRDRQQPKKTELDKLLMDEGAVNMLYAVRQDDKIGKRNTAQKLIPSKDLLNRTIALRKVITQSSIKDDSPKTLRKKDSPTLIPVPTASKERKKSRDSIRSSIQSPPPSPSYVSNRAEASRIIRRHSSSFSSECSTPRRLSIDMQQNQQENTEKEEPKPTIEVKDNEVKDTKKDTIDLTSSVRTLRRKGVPIFERKADEKTYKGKKKLLPETETSKEDINKDEDNESSDRLTPSTDKSEKTDKEKMSTSEKRKINTEMSKNFSKSPLPKKRTRNSKTEDEEQTKEQEKTGKTVNKSNKKMDDDAEEKSQRTRHVSVNCDYKEISIRKIDNLVQIILTPLNTKLKNCISIQMFKELKEVLSNLSKDDSCRVVLMTSTDSSFCHGVDFSALIQSTTEKRMSAAQEMAGSLKSFLRSLAHFSKPIIAGVQGSAVGLGVTMLPLFDLVFASDKATFSTPYGRLGQVPEGVAFLTLPNLLGNTLTSELMFANRKLTASEAVHHGLITRTLWPDKFQEETLSSSLTISTQSGQSMMATKSLLRQSLLSRLDEALESENKLLIAHWTSAECQHNFKKLLQEDEWW